MSAVVTETIQVGAAVNGKPGRMAVRLAYEPNDPYAVHAFFTGGGVTAEWAFGRDLLVNGMNRLAGAFDVQVWPSDLRYDLKHHSLDLSLSSPEGLLEVRLPHAWVNDFLLLTFDAVPAGRESDHLDVDRAIALIREDA